MNVCNTLDRLKKKIRDRQYFVDDINFFVTRL